MTTSVAVGIGLFVLLLAIGFAFAWQERHPTPELAVIYGTEDALEWVMLQLSDASKADLKRSDVRRLLEWEMLYLQDPKHHEKPDVVVGGLEAAEFAQQKAIQQGFTYNGRAIIEVLDLQAEYLHAIGAIGKPVETELLEEVMGDALEPDAASPELEGDQ